MTWRLNRDGLQHCAPAFEQRTGGVIATAAGGFGEALAGDRANRGSVDGKGRGGGRCWPRRGCGSAGLEGECRRAGWG
jgi:hypothetical protein